jgi:hypothetical protein
MGATGAVQIIPLLLRAGVALDTQVVFAIALFPRLLVRFPGRRFAVRFLAAAMAAFRRGGVE